MTRILAVFIGLMLFGATIAIAKETSTTAVITENLSLAWTIWQYSIVLWVIGFFLSMFSGTAFFFVMFFVLICAWIFTVIFKLGLNYLT